MKLEVGKAYRTRDGRKVIASWQNGGQFAILEDGAETGVFCLESGKPRYTHNWRWEIIAEWEEPAAQVRAVSRPWEQSISEIRQLSRESCAVACILAAVEGV